MVFSGFIVKSATGSWTFSRTFAFRAQIEEIISVWPANSLEAAKPGIQHRMLIKFSIE
jgi:hypothetical protein